MEGQRRGPSGGDLWLGTANPPWRDSHMVGWPRHWTSSDAWRWQAERLCLRPPKRTDSRGAIQPMLSRAPPGLAPKLDHPAPPYHLHLSSASLCPHDASSEGGDSTPAHVDGSPRFVSTRDRRLYNHLDPAFAHVVFSVILTRDRRLSSHLDSVFTHIVLSVASIRDRRLYSACTPILRTAARSKHPLSVCTPILRTAARSKHPLSVCTPILRTAERSKHPLSVCTPIIRTAERSKHPLSLREANFSGSCPQYRGSHASPHSHSPPPAPDATRASPPVHRAHRASGRSRDEILGDIERQRAFRYAALASQGLQRERGGRVPLVASRDGGVSTGARASREREARLHHQAILRAKHDLAACHQSLVYERQKPTDALRSRIAPSHRGVHARSRGAASAAVRDYDRFIAGSDASLRPHSAAAATRQAPEWVPYSCAISRYVGPTSSGWAAGGKRARKKNRQAARARAEAEARREEAAQEKAKKPSYWELLRVLGLSAIEDSGVVSSSCEADEVELPPEEELGVTKIEVSVPSIPNVRFDLPRPRSDPTRADWESVIS
ncbi:hypothetical protein AB1Y20_021753 [Prymnesium parvum]|uniref:BZIP domain-containing protein n=1 Tax=Prymnesium parvum TaxID=97485 RepID=A0AB34JJL5_PRYPA